MTENRTSQAVESIQFFDPENLRNPFDISLKAILEKYKRMEEALQQLVSVGWDGDTKDEFELCEKALAFDPLSSSK